MKIKSASLIRYFLAVFVYATALNSVAAQALSGSDLVEALRDGGYVIVMRHARSPRAQPDASTASPGNLNLERQLDEIGRETAMQMGRAVRSQQIPVGQILSSPTFRAMETVTYLELGDAQPVAELGSGGDGAWLTARAAQTVHDGTNSLFVTHRPNLSSAFGDEAVGMADGEALIVRPNGEHAVVVGRVRIEDWATLVAQ